MVRHRSPRNSLGTCSVTTAAMELNAAPYAPDGRDGRINAKYSTTTWRWLASTAVIQVAVTARAGLAAADITSHLVKIRLYDHLRHAGCAFPIPVAKPGQLHDFYYADDSVTLTDNIYLTRTKADSWTIGLMKLSWAQDWDGCCTHIRQSKHRVWMEVLG